MTGIKDYDRSGLSIYSSSNLHYGRKEASENFTMKDPGFHQAGDTWQMGFCRENDPYHKAEKTP